MTLEEFKENAQQRLAGLMELCRDALAPVSPTHEAAHLSALIQRLASVSALINGTGETDMKPLRTKLVGIAGYDHGALFATAAFGIKARDDQFENNVHLDIAEELGGRFGIEDVRVRFDEDDAQGAPLLLCFEVPADYKPLDISTWKEEDMEYQLRLVRTSTVGTLVGLELQPIHASSDEP